MDFHKLQQTLNDIEPADRNRDFEQMCRAAQGGNNAPTPRENVAESRDYAESYLPSDAVETTEAAQLAALAGINTTPRTQPRSVADEMAVLAGIPLSESQKTGSAGHARGKDPVPSKSKPSKDGEQAHPLKDKLVGSVDNDVGVSEGAWDQFKQGYKNYDQSPSTAYKGVLGGKDKTNKSSKSSKSSNSATLSPRVATALTPYSDQLTNVLSDPKLKKLFLKLMKAAESPTRPPGAQESTRYTATDRSNSIKEELLRKLNQSR
jgi:hypothetical protein